MYTLHNSDIAQFDLANARGFVEFWSQFYEDPITVFGSKDKIDYFSELNVGKDLTEENVRRLLRWKDPKYLTQRILSGPNQGRDNQRVARVLGHLDCINNFRNNKISVDAMWRVAGQVFPTGIVWKAFLLHIAKPHIHPIADDNAFRVFSLHTGKQHKNNWVTYEEYSDYFAQIAERIGIGPNPESIPQLKQIDNALIVFGRFLKAYYRQDSRSG